MTDEAKYADKIAALLRLAEDPAAAPGEVMNALEAAQRLMTKYAIDESIIRARRSITEAEEIVTESILFHSVYSRALYYIGSNLAKYNDCKVLITKGSSLMKTTLHVVGYKSDVDRVMMLTSSLRIQCDIALGNFWTNFEGWQKDRGATERDRFKVRRQFVFSFAAGMQAKLKAAQEAGIKDAVAEHGDNSVALVLRSKSDLVEAGKDTLFPNSRPGKRSKGFASGGIAAHKAGFEAGKNSDVGQAGVENNPAYLTA